MEMQMIPLSSITESPSNPRKVFGDIEDLARSIAEDGVLQPVLVRQQGRSKSKFELVVGARRYRASEVAGLETIPAVVRKLDDREVLEIQIAENNQRADVRPSEEAKAFAELRDSHGASTEDIAARLGRSTKYVQRRLRLAELAPDLVELIDNNQIPLTGGLAIASLPEEARATVTEKLVARCDDGHSINNSAVRQAIYTATRLLRDAFFDAADHDLIDEAPACAVCPHNTECQRDLFDDSNSAYCLDSACFDAKLGAEWQRQVDGPHETREGDPWASTEFRHPGWIDKITGIKTPAIESFVDDNVARVHFRFEDTYSAGQVRYRTKYLAADIARVALEQGREDVAEKITPRKADPRKVDDTADSGASPPPPVKREPLFTLEQLMAGYGERDLKCWITPRMAALAYVADAEDLPDELLKLFGIESDHGRWDPARNLDVLAFIDNADAEEVERFLIAALFSVMGAHLITAAPELPKAEASPDEVIDFRRYELCKALSEGKMPEWEAIYAD